MHWFNRWANSQSTRFVGPQLCCRLIGVGQRGECSQFAVCNALTSLQTLFGAKQCQNRQLLALFVTDSATLHWLLFWVNELIMSSHIEWITRITRNGDQLNAGDGVNEWMPGLSWRWWWWLQWLCYACAMPVLWQSYARAVVQECIDCRQWWTRCWTHTTTDCVRHSFGSWLAGLGYSWQNIIHFLLCKVEG